MNTDYCCDARPARALFYAPDRARCWRHATPEERSLTDQTEARRKALRIPHWPYGPNIDVSSRVLMLDWAEAHGLRLSRAGGCDLHLLVGQRHLDGKCRSENRWMDHVTLWNRGGKPAVLVAQPYGLNDDSRRWLGRFTAEHGLRLEVSDSQPPNWYGHGTTFVGLWRTDG